MNKLIGLGALLLLSACGFHLKGTSDVGNRLHYQDWTVSGGQMQNALENALRRQSGVRLHDDAAGSDTVQLRVLDQQQYKDVGTINIGGNTIEYLLTLRVEAQAYRRGQALGNPMTVQVQRYMDYADSEILGKQEEEAQIWRDLRREAAEQLVRRLAYLPQS